MLAVALDAGAQGQLHPAIANPLGIAALVVMTAAWGWLPSVLEDIGSPWRRVRFRVCYIPPAYNPYRPLRKRTWRIRD